jgi:hypothetical protein
VSDEQGLRKLPAGELEEVLRRAVELESREGGAGGEYTVEDAVRIASEIGVSEGSVQKALALVERDQMLVPSEPPRTLDRWFGAARVVSARNVGGPLHEVRGIVGEVVSRQLFNVVRNMGDRVIWERSEGFFDGMRRALDFDKRYRLTEVQLIDATIKDAAQPGRVDVRIELDFSPLRKSRLRKGIIWPLLIGGGLTALGGAVGFLTMPGIVFAGGGAATGAGIHMRMRSKYLSSVHEAQQAVERLLDHLEHER